MNCTEVIWPVASIMWMQSNTCITMKSSVILMSMKTIINICYLQYQIYNHGQNMLRQIATWDSFGWRAVTDTMVLRDIVICYVNQTYAHFNCSNCVHHIPMFTNPSLFPAVLFFLPPDPLEQCWATQINIYVNLTFSKPNIGWGGEGESLLFIYYCPNECYLKSQICSGNLKCLNAFVQDCRWYLLTPRNQPCCKTMILLLLKAAQAMLELVRQTVCDFCRLQRFQKNYCWWRNQENNYQSILMEQDFLHNIPWTKVKFQSYLRNFLDP